MAQFKVPFDMEKIGDTQDIYLSSPGGTRLMNTGTMSNIKEGESKEKLISKNLGFFVQFYMAKAELQIKVEKLLLLPHIF